MCRWSLLAVTVRVRSQLRGLRMLGLLAALVSCVMPSGPSGAYAQSTTQARLREAGVEPGDTGTAWIEEDFGGLFAIESIRINPPDTVFDGRSQRLLVKLLEPGDQWTTVIDLRVDPESARNPSVWPRISLAPEPPSEMAQAYELIRQEMRRRGRSEAEEHGYYLEAAWRPLEPVLARGVRFELVGPHAQGKGWTFSVSTDAMASRHGGVAHEWSYRHVW